MGRRAKEESSFRRLACSLLSQALESGCNRRTLCAITATILASSYRKSSSTITSSSTPSWREKQAPQARSDAARRRKAKKRLRAKENKQKRSSAGSGANKDAMEVDAEKAPAVFAAPVYGRLRKHEGGVVSPPARVGRCLVQACGAGEEFIDQSTGGGQSVAGMGSEVVAGPEGGGFDIRIVDFCQQDFERKKVKATAGASHWAASKVETKSPPQVGPNWSHLRRLRSATATP